MQYLVRAFPLIRSIEEFCAFTDTLLGSRREEADRFYSSYGIEHESVHLQHTPSGPMLIVVTVLHDYAAAAPRYRETSEQFDAWFKGQVRHFTGVDPNVQPLGPPSEQIYEWNAPC
jgi:hypothetical protein